MTIRLVHQSRDTTLDASPGPALWLSATQIEAATGWAWKPEGLCRDEQCVPLPPRPATPLVDGERLDLAAFWRHASWPLAHDDAGSLWLLGEGAAERNVAMASMEAPDFELPDLKGHLHRLPDFRGRRVFLATWASW